MDVTVAVSGLGSIGYQHVAALSARPETRVIGFDPDPELRSRAAALGHVAEVTGDFPSLLDRGPDALVIAGPDEVHAEQAVAGRGIPTLVEKPLGPSYAAARDLAERLSGAPVLVGYVLRYREAVRIVRDVLAGGDLGEPVSCHVMLGAYGTITAAASRFDRPSPGRLYRDYSHEWDYLRWFFGPIAECHAVERTVEGVPHVETPNAVDGMLSFADGLVGTFHLDYLEPCGLRVFQAVGTGGSLLADLGRGEVIVRSAGVDHERRYACPEPPSAALRRQLDHLLDGTPPRVGVADGVAALAVAEAVAEAARTRSWVPVPGPAA